MEVRNEREGRDRQLIQIRGKGVSKEGSNGSEEGKRSGSVNKERSGEVSAAQIVWRTHFNVSICTNQYVVRLQVSVNYLLLF